MATHAALAPHLYVNPKKKTTQFALPGLEAYGWEAHDGEAFGRQELTDGCLRLTTSLAKRFCRGCVGGDWAVRLAARALGPGSGPQGGGDGAGPLRPPQQASFVFYIADENVRLPVSDLNPVDLPRALCVLVIADVVCSCA